MGDHLDARNRRLHVLGTGAALAFLLIAVVTSQFWWLAAALVAGYALAWIEHVVIERNRPATLRHPFYSLLGDFRMSGLILTGRMQREIDRVRAERTERPWPSSSSPPCPEPFGPPGGHALSCLLRRASGSASLSLSCCIYSIY